MYFSLAQSSSSLAGSSVVLSRPSESCRLRVKPKHWFLTQASMIIFGSIVPLVLNRLTDQQHFPVFTSWFERPNHVSPLHPIKTLPKYLRLSEFCCTVRRFQSSFSITASGCVGPSKPMTSFKNRIHLHRNHPSPEDAYKRPPSEG